MSPVTRGARLRSGNGLIQDRAILLPLVPLTERNAGTPGSAPLPVTLIDLKSDVLIDTSVISRVKGDAPTRRWLIRRLNGLTSVKGAWWIAVETLTELIRRSPGERLQASALRRIDRELRCQD